MLWIELCSLQKYVDVPILSILEYDFFSFFFLEIVLS